MQRRICEVETVSIDDAPDSGRRMDDAVLLAQSCTDVLFAQEWLCRAVRADERNRGRVGLGLRNTLRRFGAIFERCGILRIEFLEQAVERRTRNAEVPTRQGDILVVDCVKEPRQPRARLSAELEGIRISEDFFEICTLVWV